jgi:hypothetical protein
MRAFIRRILVLCSFFEVSTHCNISRDVYHFLSIQKYERIVHDISGYTIIDQTYEWARTIFNDEAAGDGSDED